MSNEHNASLSDAARSRSQSLLRYLAALEHGRLDVLADVCWQAERDPALLALLLAANDIQQTGAARASDEEIAQAQAMLWASFAASTAPVNSEVGPDGRLETAADEVNALDGDDRRRPTKAPATRRRPSGRLRVAQGLVAALVAAALVGGFFTVFQRLGQGSHTSSGAPGTTVIIPQTPNAQDVFVGSSTGVIMALRERDGAVLWSYNTGMNVGINATIFDLTAQNGLLIAAAQNGLLALRQRDGKLLWRHDLEPQYGGNQVAVGFAMDAGVVVTNTLDGAQAYRESDGAPLWQKPGYGFETAAYGVTYLHAQNAQSPYLAVRTIDGKQLWQKSYGTRYLTALTTTPQATYFLLSSPDPQFLAVQPITGAQIWDHPAPSGSDNVYMGLLGQNAYLFSLNTPPNVLCVRDLATWRQLWCAAPSASGAVFSMGDLVYVIETDEELIHTYQSVQALAGATGASVWSWRAIVHPGSRSTTTTGANIPPGYSIPSSPSQLFGVRGVLYVSTEDGVFALNGSDGRLLWHSLVGADVPGLTAA